ncbi:hypothetical protein MIND_01306700 [Mycena indigotica]|uniref:Uncharacterized protein n=1 Tax=Mycena indigotica TaxID=2126181 RepID=A0A8H6VWD6_9AGAR|nr:uncharacterized protein MIND_01306700 [Mycena indigotica]KAF7290664.1 hypothetical protein MIND_01306700 [Mycena indigotica]
MTARRVRMGEMTISQRAKEWYSTPFTVEWLENTIKGCTSSPGKEAFEKWAISKLGASQGAVLIAECNKRSPRGTFVSEKPPRTLEDKVLFMWNSAAGYYGMSRRAIQTLHEHASDMNLYQPERTKPPPKRRKGETSSQWLALVAGHKLPIIDLDYARRTAIAEYDKTCDTLERWRTDSKLFFADIVERSKSIIVSPQIVHLDERTKERTRIDDAFRTRINFLALTHVAWKETALLFEDLAARGLNTPAAIERAYSRDSALLWRLCGVVHRVASMTRKMSANLQQLLAASDYYKPMLVPWRDDQGLAHIDPNRPEIDKRIRRGELTGMDQVVISWACSVAPSPMSFYQGIEAAIAEDRSEEKKFSAAVFEAMGDWAAAAELESQFSRTEFGMQIVKQAGALEKAGTDRAQMRSILYYMDPAKLSDRGAEYWDRAGEASRSMRALEVAWTHQTWQLSIDSILRILQMKAAPRGLTSDNIEMPMEVFNEMWRHTDEQMWNMAASLDRKGEAGRVAKECGLWNPRDPKRPVATRYIFAEIELQIVQGVPLQPKTTPVYTPNIPVAGPNESIVQSGHAFVSGTAETKVKVKTRTPGDASKQVEQVEKVEQVTLPQHLPTDFKLGKKVLKLFHRILEPPDDEKESADAPAKGQVRWGDFENAMKRIGFEVVQTAGSSVRFDPPALSARPITFHRPHPESLLSPHSIKWLGARLRRTYGWTTATFQRTEGEEAG